jgi:undecaprenyl-diphosphatase
METILELDKELFLFLNNLGSTTWDGFWMAYTNKVNWIPFYLLLLFLMFKKVDKKVLLIIVLSAIAMVAFTDQVTNLFKDGFERLRPCREESLSGIMRMVKDYCGTYGFFSGHSSNSMAVAVFVGLLLRPYYKYLVFILLFWSFLMAYSRVYIGVHYPLDIISGMAFGAISGFLFFKLVGLLEKRFG